jgi:bifunctional non-homologous end joining protein LigD
MRSKAGGDRLRFIEFQLPTLVDRPPEGDAWIHEIKYDGYRTEPIIDRGEARAFTRRGFDWTEKYRPIVEAAAALPAKAAIIDAQRRRPVGLQFIEIGNAMAAEPADLRCL